MAKVNAFTSRSTKGLQRVLITQCWVSPGFDPDTTPPAEHQKYSEFAAIWDTGASASVITRSVADKCGLRPISMREVHHAGGKELSEAYLVNIGLPNKVNFRNVNVTLGKLPDHAQLLIGMDIICTGDFCVTNAGGRTVFSFRHPAQAEIDFVKEADGAGGQGAGRNSPCPCGSGKKYKRCHGVGA